MDVQRLFGIFDRVMVICEIITPPLARHSCDNPKCLVAELRAMVVNLHADVILANAILRAMVDEAEAEEAGVDGAYGRLSGAHTPRRPPSPENLSTPTSAELNDAIEHLRVHHPEAFN